MASAREVLPEPTWAINATFLRVSLFLSISGSFPRLALNYLRYIKHSIKVKRRIGPEFFIAK
jgi:hypothetical protein